MLGDDGGPTQGALSDGVPGMEPSEHHNPPEMLDGLDGKTSQLNFLNPKTIKLRRTYSSLHCLTTVELKKNYFLKPYSHKYNITHD